MDPRTFDCWTSAVAHRPTRRAALRLLAGSLLGGLLARAGAGAARAAQCDAGLTLCNGFCVDLLSDVVNCGSCEVVCGVGLTCQGGGCAEVIQPCAAWQTDCGGVCVDLVTDALNCGVCGLECAYGESCAGGACQSACATGLSMCNGVCVDTATDPANCGGCGSLWACGTLQSCQGGACVGIELDAEAGEITLSCEQMGLTDCGGVCVDLLTDHDNCGACGNSCYPGLCSKAYPGTCTVCTEDIVAPGFCAGNP
jgi:hypothetical protein